MSRQSIRECAAHAPRVYSTLRSPTGALLTLAEETVLVRLRRAARGAFVASKTLIPPLREFRNGEHHWDAVLGGIIRSLKQKGFLIESARVLRGQVRAGARAATDDLPKGAGGYRLMVQP